MLECVDQMPKMRRPATFKLPSIPYMVKKGDSTIFRQGEDKEHKLVHHPIREPSTGNIS